MEKVRFISLRLLFAVSMTIVMFNSYGQIIRKDSLTYDEGVVINGIKWATRNVAEPGAFAVKPEDAGMFYQWNSRIAWSATDPMLNSDGYTDWDYSTPEGDTWKKSNDPSPVGWRVPALDDVKKLLDTEKVINEWTKINDVSGIKFTDKTSGKSIFLPAVGWRYSGDGELNYVGSYGYYWSCTQNESHDNCAHYLNCGNRGAEWGYLDSKSFGLSVRPVAN